MLQETPPATTFEGTFGLCGQREVFLGFAPASVLYRLSFADILNEETGLGYQRRFSPSHSLDFRRYILSGGASTIPLTLNLRPRADGGWRVERMKDGARLRISETTQKVFTQVDCQHRLGNLSDSAVSLAFMTFLGLTPEEEMEMFTIINGKAKGLSASLIDYNRARLSQDLASEAPNLYIALLLNTHEDSPWCQRLHLGGTPVVGLKRRASLRTMQVAITKFLKGTNAIATTGVEEVAHTVLDFWIAVANTLRKEWNDPRHYLVTKGIGVYSLMLLAVDLFLDAAAKGMSPGLHFFSAELGGSIRGMDWSNHGPLEGFNGEGGAVKAYKLLRDMRCSKPGKVTRGQ